MSLNIHQPNAISVWCMLFGHTGNETESGYHVCSRCGLHAYHGGEDYDHAAILASPWWFLWMNLWIEIHISHWRWEIEFLYYDDDYDWVPF